MAVFLNLSPPKKILDTPLSLSLASQNFGGSQSKKRGVYLLTLSILLFVAKFFSILKN